MRRLLLILFFLSVLLRVCPDGVAKEFPYIRKAEAKVRVTFTPSTGAFTYSYSITNSPESLGKIVSIRIDLSRVPGSEQVGPGSLVSNPNIYAKQLSEWEMKRAGGNVIPVAFVSTPQSKWLCIQGKTAEFIGGDDVFIAPGKTLGEFVMASLGPVGIRQVAFKPIFELEEYFPSIDTPGFTDDQILKIIRDTRAAKKAIEFKILSLGPTSFPEGGTLSDKIGFLISEKEKAVQLGWIDNQGVANSLNKKLAVAKVRVETGQKAAGNNVLHAFIHELQAQQGKHINDNAFYLLKANTEFLIFKLESR